MGYSTSLDTFTAVQEYLNQVLTGTAAGWELETPRQAKIWAYKIREAFHIIKAHPEQLGDYLDMAERFEVYTTGKMVGVRVRVAKNPPIPKVIIPIARAPLASHDAPAVPLVTAASGDVAVKWSAESVADYMKANPGEEKIFFPKIYLPPDEMMKLYEWCEAQTPRYIMFVVAGDVTVRKFAEEWRDLHWTPEDL